MYVFFKTPIMKTSIKLLSILLGFVFLAFTFAHENNTRSRNVAISDTSASFLDGSYEAFSQGGYTAEPFWGHIFITVESGLFSEVLFTIRDTTTHEPVDSMYGVIHYSGNPEYMQQCVNDGHGIEEYPARLMQSQNLDKVDAITGATWSYNIFMASADKALENAHKPNSLNDVNTYKEIDVIVWPNPYTDFVNLEYRLPEKLNIQFAIYNHEGKLIDRLVNGLQAAGIYRTKWSNHSAPGVYFYHFAAGSVILSGQFICVK